jgi:hypothetical protein
MMAPQNNFSGGTAFEGAELPICEGPGRASVQW